MRVEVLGGVERRRRWSSDDKTRMVAETLAPGATVTEVAHRNGVSVSLLFTWRRQARSEPGIEEGPHFVPLRISAPAREENAAGPVAAATAPLRPAAAARNGMIEIDLGNRRRIRVDGQFDADALARVVEILERR
jgi:transposase